MMETDRKRMIDLTIEHAQEILDLLYDQIPDVIFRELNGGVVLTPETVWQPPSVGENLLILGQYHVNTNGLGRYITIYYGSVMRAYGNLSDEEIAVKLKELLHHELTHHLESLAGDRSLEIEDAITIHKILEEREPNQVETPKEE